jgi:putative ABC transport system permease protein
MDPAWLKAPLLYLRFPAILFSLVTATAILGATTAAAPLMLSSAGNAALEQEVEQAGEDQIGLSYGTFGLIDRETFEPADQQVRRAGAALPRLEDPTVMVEGASTRVANEEGTESSVRLLSRTGALDNIEKLTPDRGIEGVWISNTNADELGIRPGDEITLDRLRVKKTMTVAGIYRNLASAPISEYWRPLTFHIINPTPNQPPLYPYLIMDIDTLLDVADGLGQQATFSWDFAMPWADPTLPEARRIGARFLDARLAASDPLTDIGRAFDAITQYGSMDVHTSLTQAIRNSEETVTAIEGPVLLISLAGRIVALAVIAAAGLFSYTRRRVEARLLSAQGRTPWWQGAKASAEALVPAAIGGVMGWLAGQGLVRLAGPSDRISAGVPLEALKEVGWWLLIAIVLLGIVYAAAAHQESQLGASRIKQLFGRVPWELVLLVLAIASLYEVRTREGAIVQTPDQAAQIDLFLLAFPFLFLAAICGLASRGLRALLPKTKMVTSRGSSWSYLAARRFAGGQKVGFLLITASAIAIGVLVYSGTLVATTSTTVTSKAQVLAGSDVAASIQNIEHLPEDFPFPFTRVTMSGGNLLPSDAPVDILALDPDTFDQGAFWDDSFADRPLEELLTSLETDGPRLPVILVAQSSPTEATVDTRGVDVPITVVETARAWPGMRPNNGFMIVDSDTFDRVAVASGGFEEDPAGVDEIWIKGDHDAIFEAFEDNGLIIDLSRSAVDIQEAPSLRSLSWTFGFLQALGVMAGLIAIVGLVLYLQSRQQSREVSYALARRMGLTRGSHRLAIASELFAMLVTSTLIGGITAIIAARLVASEIDPLPGLPPGALFRVPTALLWAAPVVAIVVALLGAWNVQRKADRTNVAEVMRLAT